MVHKGTKLVFFRPFYETLALQYDNFGHIVQLLVNFKVYDLPFTFDTMGEVKRG